MSSQLFFSTSSHPHRPNFRMGTPPDLPPSPALALQDKMRRVPAFCLDQLHPEENAPFVEYVDEGLWKNRIDFQKDNSYSVASSKRRAEAHQPYENLDALCEAELGRRFPNYQIITGFKAALKNTFPTLTRLAIGADQFYKQLTRKEFDKLKKQIAYSAINRDDMIAHPKIEDPALRQQLNLEDDSVLQTEHLFAKNSTVNGQSYILDKKTIHLSQAIACPNDRKVKNTGNLRLIQTKEKDSICYTGRADSDRKALEQASFIFLNELKTKGKGITKTVDANGDAVYQLDYVANSMLSLPWIWKGKSAIAPFPEREYLDNERKAFLAFKAKGAVTIEDPNNPGTTYQVKFNPILFSHSSNFFTRLEKWLPPFVTGQAKAETISEEGFAEFKALVAKKLASEVDKEKISRIQCCMQILEQNLDERHLQPEQEWFVRDYLCKLIEIPFIYHCKSSTDRTSATVAMSSALRQWIDLKLPIPEYCLDLLKDARFKELFATNWMVGHQVTRYARGGKGTVAGEKLNDKNLGLHLSRGIGQNPVVGHLVPQRYLKDFPANARFKYLAAYIPLIIPIAILFYLPLICFTAIRQLAHLATGNRCYQVAPNKFTLPRLASTLVCDFPKIFPKKVLNEDSPQVGGRLLIAGGKNGGKKDND